MYKYNSNLRTINGTPFIFIRGLSVVRLPLRQGNLHERLTDLVNSCLLVTMIATNRISSLWRCLLTICMLFVRRDAGSSSVHLVQASFATTPSFTFQTFFHPSLDNELLLKQHTNGNRILQQQKHNKRIRSRPFYATPTTPVVNDSIIINGSTKNNIDINTTYAQNKNNDIDDDPFTLLATLAATTLLQSDRRRDAIGKDVGAQASSATNWIDEGSSFAFRSALDKLKLYLPNGENDETTSATTQSGRERQDEAITWLRWLRSIPRPVIVDLSHEVRIAANDTVSDDFLRLLNLNTDETPSSSSISSGSPTTQQQQQFSSNKMKQIRIDFLNRLRCQLILIPSGQSMQGSGLFEPAGSLTFGKLLSGGVTRYRILPSSSNNSNDNDGALKPPRRAGERTERKISKNEHIPSWVQYGGTQRKYDAVDMGPAMVLEWSLLPKIQGGGDSTNSNDVNAQIMQKGEMMLHRLAWRPQHMFRYITDDKNVGQSIIQKNGAKSNGETTSGFNAPSSLHGKDRNDVLMKAFRSRVGGLGPQIDAIVRRVLDGRVIRPAEVDGNGNLLSYKDAKDMLGANDDGGGNVNGHEDDEFSLDNISRQLSMAALEAEELALLGLSPVRGLLLYGPPGCGKVDSVYLL